MAEHAAVNRRVVGSSPTRGAKVPITTIGTFCFMDYSLYILRSQRNGKYYIGSSKKPVKRVLYHNSIEKGFTSRYRPWKLVYIKKYSAKTLAQAAERRVKSWKSRKMIEKLINGEIDV